jgi:hypothetical protein
MVGCKCWWCGQNAGATESPNAMPPFALDPTALFTRLDAHSNGRKHMKTHGLVIGSIILISSSATHAQNQFIMPDRDSDAVFRAFDFNNDGVIADPAEIFPWFDNTNAEGTAAPMNPTALGINTCRDVIMGDQQVQAVFRFKDLDGNGDALGKDESIIFSGPGNSLGLSFAFPTGVAFDTQCTTYIVNAGNAFGPDAIYRLIDLNGDGDAMDEVEGVHETDYYVGAPVFGEGNGPFSPQEIIFDANDVGYLRNSSANLHGLYRFEDLDNNGRADDPNEFTVFWNASNAAGTPASAGFPIAFDRARPGAIYGLQLASGGVDQLYRLQDLNNDLDAQDVDPKGVKESEVVWTYAGANFTNVDLVCLANGDVLITDNSSITIALLHDGDGDGKFISKGEQTTYFAGGVGILQSRQLEVLCSPGDVNCDGTVDVDDLLGVINNWGPAQGCEQADITCNGTVDVDDLLNVINNWS